MFPPTRYLRWARRLYGQVRFDLASSGIPTAPWAELGFPAPAQLDDPTGYERLHDAVAAHNAVGRDEALPALGTTHALWLAYAALTSPGDEALVEEPAYEPLVRIAEGMGVGVARFARDARDGFGLDPDRIARAMTARTRVVCVSNLHNPSGVRAPDDALRDAARAAERGGAHLLVDEVYAPFDALVDDRGVFDRSARRAAPNVVAVSSLTKCYGVGPARAGWLLGPRDVVARAEDALVASAGALPLVHAHAALHAFGCIGALARRARGMLAGKRARVAAWVQQQGLAWSAPAEGLFGLVTVPGAGDLTDDIEAIAREREVLVAAGAFFGAPSAFRLAWSSPADVLDEALARLAEGLSRLRSVP